MIAASGVTVVYNEQLDRTSGKGVTMEGKRIKSFTTLSGKTYSGRMFIDATYVGDLMAAAGVTFTVGREPEEQYGEDMNGVRRGDTNPRVHYGQKDKDHFVKEVDPYVKPGDPSSGLLKERYEAAGGSISVKLIPGRGHEISPAFFECPELIEFILKHSRM